MGRCKTYYGTYRRRTKGGHVRDQGVSGENKCGKIGDKGGWVSVHWSDWALLLTMNLMALRVQFR